MFEFFKIDIAEDYSLIRDFEQETRVSLDAENRYRRKIKRKRWNGIWKDKYLNNI